MIGVALDEALQKSAGFHEAARPQHSCHWNLEEAIGNTFSLCFLLTHSNARELGIREEAEGYLPACGHMVSSQQVVADHAEVIFADVRELRTSCDFSNRPHARRGRLQT